GHARDVDGLRVKEVLAVADLAAVPGEVGVDATRVDGGIRAERGRFPRLEHRERDVVVRGGWRAGGLERERIVLSGRGRPGEVRVAAGEHVEEADGAAARRIASFSGFVAARRLDVAPLHVEGTDRVARLLRGIEMQLEVGDGRTRPIVDRCRT